ncbi:MAG TPA: hypothetical protein VHT73_18590 [Thermodesulfobacteriota bacterium]|nr:hypothetical protein [Thermodesulfobacteriota bacterium]
MKLYNFTEEEVLLEGSWSDYHGQRRYIGRLTSGVGICAVSFVSSEQGFYYSKSNRAKTGELDVDLLIHGLPNADSFQIVLRIGRGTNYKAWFHKDCQVNIENEIRFKTGHLIDLAEPDTFGDTIKLLVLCKGDVRPKRGGIWTVKPRHSKDIHEPWLSLLTKTRRGFVAF